MSIIAAERPQFFEGQYLSADDLAAIVDYLRVTNARQNIGQHTWGVVIGLELVSQEISDTAVEYYVQPGVAIDGYGRIIVVSEPALIDPEKFVSITSGNVDIWIGYRESEFEATRKGFQVCAAQDNYARINETYVIDVGSKLSILDRQSGVTINEQLVVDAREALVSVDPESSLLCDASIPHQQLPVNDEDSIWLIPLGHVKWSSASTSFLPLVDPTELDDLAAGTSAQSPDQVYEALIASRAKRRLIGTVSESIFAADGVIRLRKRSAKFDASVTNDSVCNKSKIQSVDLKVCDGELIPKELVWLEGDVRVTGDVRLFDGRIEFKNDKGSDYVERTVAGSLVSAISPLLIQRTDGNSKGGSDLQILLGQTDDGSNRLAIGSILFEGSDICDLSIDTQNQVVIQDNGRVGIGTINPDSVLESPYTVRGLSESVIENQGTEDEFTYDIYRLETFESDGGVKQWQIDLWDDEESDRKSLNIAESNLSKSNLFLQTGGKVGIGVTEPKEQLHIQGDDPAIFVDINGDSGLNYSELKLGSDGDVNLRLFWSKNSDKFYVNHNGNNTIVVDEKFVGIGTSNPQVPLQIDSGTDVTLSDSSGYVVIGDIDDKNIAIDLNEIQARDNGAKSPLYFQNEGGDFVVQPNDSSRFVVKDGGKVGIGTASPNEKLDVRGDIKLGSDGSLFALAGVDNMRTVVGKVSSSGNEEQGAGYNVVKGATGRYTILFEHAFSSPPIVVANSYGNSDNILSVSSVTNNSCVITVRDIRDANNISDVSLTQYENQTFNFIAMGGR